MDKVELSPLRFMDKVELSPLRSWDDFFPGWDRFGCPDVKDSAKWSNRAVSNLLFYQSNYLSLSAALLLLLGLVYPLEMFTAVVVVPGVAVGSVWAGQNISSLQRQKPAAAVVAVVLASCLVVHMLGSLMVVLFAVTLPLSLTFAHASFRLRNMKNKLENKMEGAGLKRTPMGVILDLLRQQENFQKTWKQRK